MKYIVSEFQMIMKTYFTFSSFEPVLLFSFLVLSSFTLAAQGGTSVEDRPSIEKIGMTAASATIFSTFAQEDQLRITIKADFANLIANKQRLDDYQPASLSYVQGDIKQEMSVKIKPRGKSRRRSCDFPPLKVKFKKEDLANNGLVTQHKSLKLVTHCLEDETGEQNLLKEYLAYKLYNQLTAQSFRVKLAEVVYEDVNGIEEPKVRYGFIIENTNEMAERLGGTECEDCYNVSVNDVAKRRGNLINLYQYMIGNTDWNSIMLHNVKIVKLTNGETVIVPYDFDSSGMVNASYARPNPDYAQLTVRDRVYMGKKVEELKDIRSIMRYMKLKKKEMRQTIKDFKLLTKSNRRDVLSYLDTFFEIIENETLAEGEFVERIP